MTREEIREGIEEELLKAYGTSAHQGKVSSQEMFAAGQILKHLHSQDVVIRGNSLGGTHPHLANYFTVLPLIEEE